MCHLPIAAHASAKPAHFLPELATTARESPMWAPSLPVLHSRSGDAQARLMLPPRKFSFPGVRSTFRHGPGQIKMNTVGFLMVAPKEEAANLNDVAPQEEAANPDPLSWPPAIEGVPGHSFPPGTAFDSMTMKHLGMGQFGDCWEATDPETGSQSVVKVFHARTGETSWEYLSWNQCDKRMKWTMTKSIEECKVVQKMVETGKELYPSGASHICECKDEHISPGIANPNDVMYTVWESGGHEDLKTLKLPESLSDRVRVARTITKQVAEVLVLLSMFDPPIIHHDLKPDNIMIKGNLQEGFDVKVIDFGCFIPASEEMRTSISMGDEKYMPPEHAWECAFADPPSSLDMWALGLIHMQLICPEYTTEHWYPADGSAPVAATVMQGLRQHCPDMVAYDDLQLIAKDMQLIQSCLSLKPSDRPQPGTVVELLTSFLEGMGSDLSNREKTTFKKGDSVEMLSNGQWSQGVVLEALNDAYDIWTSIPCDGDGCSTFTDVQPAHVKRSSGGPYVLDVKDVRPTADMFGGAPGPYDASMAQWNAGQTYLLGPDKARFEDKAVLLDQTSVSDVIEQLNTKGWDNRPQNYNAQDLKIMQAIRTGFCVVWSARNEAYYLVYARDHQEAAYAAFDIQHDPNQEKEPEQQIVQEAPKQEAAYAFDIQDDPNQEKEPEQQIAQEAPKQELAGGQSPTNSFWALLQWL